MQDAAVVFAVDVVQVLAPVRSAFMDRNGTADFRSLEGDPCIHRVDAVFRTGRPGVDHFDSGRIEPGVQTVCPHKSQKGFVRADGHIGRFLG